MGWVAACVLVVFLLPLLGALYLDILETKHEAKKQVEKQVEKMEKLRKQIEQKERDKNK